jgi:predicted Holliday junction resolvase-like endonuclease
LKKIKSYPFYNTDNPLLTESNQLDIFKGKTFLEFNDIIGLPVKNGKEHPINDYELDVIDKIEKNRNIWIKKSEI